MNKSDMNGSDEISDISNVGAALAYAESKTLSDTIVVSVDDLNEEVIVTRDGDKTTLTPARDLLAEWAPAPLRRKGTVKAHSIEDFVAIVNHDKRPTSRIFADVGKKTMTAVLDFHGPANSAPSFCEDRVEYGFTLSRQFTKWSNLAGSQLSQKEFAKLIDDNLSDIGEGALAPESIAAQFAARRNVTFASVKDLVIFTRSIASKSAVEAEEMFDENTGNTSVQYKKKNDVKTHDGTPVEVPSAFFLRIPILNGIGATEYNIAVRLRFDIEEKRGLLWRVELHAADHYIQLAIEHAIAAVKLPATAPADWKPAVEGDVYKPGCGLPVYLAAIP